MMQENIEINNIPEFPELLDFVGLKKKKKVRFPKDGFDIFEKEQVKIVPEPIVLQPDPADEPSGSESDLSFDVTKKKKKRKKICDELNSMETVESDATDLNSLCLSVTMSDNDADYTYEDLLTRVFSIMREKDPNRDVDNRKKLVMKPPQVIRIGTKKSSFVNFLEVCKLLHRVPQHIQSFLLVELGTSGSIDGNNQLIIKGRFEQRQLESVLRRYIKEYVTCHTCRSPDTILQKDTRLFFLQCESCGSRCSVASVKSGYQALTSKRAAMRAKTS